MNGNDTILLYIAEDSYVIDLDDHVDEAEILKMVKNTYSKFNQTFDIRKLDTVLRNKALMPLNEKSIDLHAIYHLLNQVNLKQAHSVKFKRLRSSQFK